MKKILLILALFIPLMVKAQVDYYAKDLPEYTVVANDSSDVLYIDDSGIDKHIEIPAFIDLVHDSTNQLRGEVDAIAADLESQIGGGGAFSKVGNKIYPTVAGDSLIIGGTMPTEKFHVVGNAKITGDVNAGGLYLDYGGADAFLFGSGDDLYLQDGNNSAITLTTLRGGLFGLTSTTRYPITVTDNWNFGGNTSTTYKLKVTGTANITGNVLFDSYTKWGPGWIRTSTAYVDEGIEIGSDNSTAYATFGFYLNKSYFETNVITYGAMSSAPPLGIGVTWSDEDGHLLYCPDGYVWDTLNGGGMLSSHMTDTLWFDYLDGAANGTRFLIPTVTGAVDTGTLPNARVGLQKRLGSFFIYFFDRVNGELKYYWEDKDGKLHSQYGLKGLGLEGIQAIAINVEFVMRWMFRQWLFIILILVWCVRLEFKLRKR